MYIEYRRAWAEIDLAAVAHNVRAVRAVVPAHTRLMGVVKADAYGHGSVVTAKTLLANGAEMLGVALCEEALHLQGRPVPLRGYRRHLRLYQVV